MNLREAIAHGLERLGEGELELVLAFMNALDRWAQVLSESADPVAQRAIAALWTARAIAKADGITDEDTLEEMQAYRASKPAPSVHLPLSYAA